MHGFRRKLFATIFSVTLAGSAMAQERAIMQEDFQSNSAGWLEQNDERISAKVEGGFYKMEMRKADGLQVFLCDETTLQTAQDFEISTRLFQKLGGREDGFGLVFGALDANNYHAFTINANSQFRVTQYKAGNLHEIKPFSMTKTPLTVINKDVLLTVRKKGVLLSFYANDKCVYSMPFQGLAGTKAGFVVYNKMEVHAKNIVVRQGNAMPEIFEDLFENNTNKWVTTSADSNKCVFARGNLVMRGVKPGPLTFHMRENVLNTERDFEIELTLKQIAGDQDKGYGLVWGAADDQNGYMFMINSFGNFCVRKREAGKEANIIDWTSSEQPLHLRVTSNKLSIRKSGQQYAFYLNDLWIASAPFSAFFGQKMGFVLTDDIRTEIEYLVVREGEKSIAPEPPVITILSPVQGGTLVDAKKVQFKAGITSKSKLKGIKLMVNNEQVAMQATKDATGQFDILIDQELSLKSGENEIALLAKNEEGLIQKALATVTVKMPESAVERKGMDYALFFATGDYAQWSDLTNPVNDARTIAQELETNYGYNTELVIDASQKDILSKLKEYARKTYQDGDQLLVFFAGHGKFDEYFGEGYVVCTDSEKDDDGNKSYISHSSLRTIINNIPCKHTFLVMDVCFGGTIDPFIASSSHRGNDDIPNEVTHDDFVERKLKFKTRKYLTSGGKEYVPDGAPGAHSPFARKFLEALRNYGGQDRIITLGELVLYFERLAPEPRFGEFGGNEPGSDFLFIAR